MQQKFSLSCKNLKNLNIDLYEKDFTFFINENEIKTTKFIADILSPLISKLHRCDPTLDYYKINISKEKYNDQFDFNKIINLVLNIGSKDNQEYDQLSLNDQILIKEILIQLQNEDFENSFDDPIDKSNVFERIKLKSMFKKYNINLIRDEINFISQNFHKFDDEELFQLPLPIIDLIISNSYLVVSSEDSLLEFIFHLLHFEQEKNVNEDVNSDKCKYDRIRFINSFFEHVEFIHVSEEKFSEFISEFDIEYLTNGTWRSICERISSKVQSENKKTISSRHSLEKNEFLQDKDQGIISYMYQKCVNPFSKGIVNISSSSTYNDNHHPINVTKSNEKSFYLSNDEPDQWIMYDFPKNEIIPYFYSLGSTCGWGSDEENICNWAIEVSNDGHTWIEVDRQEENPDLNGSNITKKFTVQKNIRCKSIRIRQIGKNTYNRLYLALSYFEIYGEIL